MWKSHHSPSSWLRRIGFCQKSALRSLPKLTVFSITPSFWCRAWEWAWVWMKWAEWLCSRCSMRGNNKSCNNVLLNSNKDILVWYISIQTTWCTNMLLLVCPWEEVPKICKEALACTLTNLLLRDTEGLSIRYIILVLIAWRHRILSWNNPAPLCSKVFLTSTTMIEKTQGVLIKVRSRRSNKETTVIIVYYIRVHNERVYKEIIFFTIHASKRHGMGNNMIG